MLRDTDDPSVYANLFYRGRSESPTPTMKLHRIPETTTDSAHTHKLEAVEDGATGGADESTQYVPLISSDTSAPQTQQPIRAGGARHNETSSFEERSDRYRYGAYAAGHGNATEFLEDNTSSRPSSLGTSEGLFLSPVHITSSLLAPIGHGFIIRHVERVSVPKVTENGIRPVSTHVSTGDLQSTGPTPPREGHQRPATLSPSVQGGRESSYSAASNESRVTTIISDFPDPPSLMSSQDHPTPSAEIEMYFPFTSADETPKDRIPT